MKDQTSTQVQATGKAPVVHARSKKLIEPRWQLGVACVVSMMILGSGALYMLGVKVLGSDSIVRALGSNGHNIASVAFDVAYFLGLVAIVHRVVVRMTHSVVGPAFAIERSLRQLARGDLSARFSLRDGDMLVDVADAANELLATLQSRQAAVTDEIENLSVAGGDEPDVQASLDRLRAAFAVDQSGSDPAGADSSPSTDAAANEPSGAVLPGEASQPHEDQESLENAA